MPYNYGLPQTQRSAINPYAPSVRSNLFQSGVTQPMTPSGAMPFGYEDVYSKIAGKIASAKTEEDYVNSPQYQALQARIQEEQMSGAARQADQEQAYFDAMMSQQSAQREKAKAEQAAWERSMADEERGYRDAESQAEKDALIGGVQLGLTGAKSAVGLYADRPAPPGAEFAVKAGGDVAETAGMSGTSDQTNVESPTVSASGLTAKDSLGPGARAREATNSYYENILAANRAAESSKGAYDRVSIMGDQATSINQQINTAAKDAQHWVDVANSTDDEGAFNYAKAKYDEAVAKIDEMSKQYGGISEGSSSDANIADVGGSEASSYLSKAGNANDARLFYTDDMQKQILGGVQEKPAAKTTTEKPSNYAGNIVSGIGAVQSGLDLYQNLSSKDPNYARAALSGANTVNSALNAVGVGTGATSPILGGLTSAVGIYDAIDKGDVAGGLRSAYGGAQAINAGIQAAAYADAIASGATAAEASAAASGAGSGALSAVALPMAYIAAAEMSRPYLGKPGVSSTDMNIAEKRGDSFVTTGTMAQVSPSTLFAGDNTPARRNEENMQFLDRRALAPIDWLFGDSTAFDRDIVDKEFDAFKDNLHLNSRDWGYYSGKVGGGIMGGMSPLGPLGGLLGSEFGGWVGEQFGGIFEDTHICTATKKHAMMTEIDVDVMKSLRQYAEENHPNWLRPYMLHGPKLIKAIEEQEKDLPNFYDTIREILVKPVVGIFDLDPEKAYQIYLLVTQMLFIKYLPSFKFQEEE